MKIIRYLFLIISLLQADIFDVSIPENDTASYNYADFRIWINDSTDTLRGIYWFMHPNNGDSRNIVTDSAYQCLVNGQNFALMGAHIYNMHMSSGIGDAVVAAMDSFAILSQHSEVSFLPFFINGYSWGGQFGYHFTKWLPERVVGFITQKGGYHDTTNAGDAIEVPGLMLIGENDLPYRIENLTEIFLNHRPLGAKWALAVEQEAGHSLVTDYSFLHSFFNEVVELRLPNNMNIFEPVILSPLPDTISWLGNQDNWTIGSWECYNGDYNISSWLPSREIAENWQIFSSDSSVYDTVACNLVFDSNYVFFSVGIHGANEQSNFIITSNDTELIDQCRSQLELPEEERLFHINGSLDYGDAGFNQPWSWHIIPNEWSLAEMSIGVCNGEPEDVENDLDNWIDNIGQLCNWSSFIKNEISFGCDSNEVLLFDSCFSIDNTTEIDFSNNNLFGTVPAEIGDLINLDSINLRNNLLYGEIPSTIGNLSNLISLDLSNNELNGEIPDIFHSLGHLEQLRLSENDLNGIIPNSICNIHTQLYQLDLHSNNLCPPYPNCITLGDLGNQDTSNCLQVNIKNENIISKFKLYHAYPNPFNPITTISYYTPSNGLVDIKVYDSAGKEIITLYHGYEVRGQHYRKWDAFEYPSGIYFIRLTMDEKTQLKKVLLLK